MTVNTLLGVAALAAAALGLAARYVAGLNRPVLVIAALSPYLAVGAPAAVLLFTVKHYWIGVAVRWRWYVGGNVGPGVAVRVVSSNLRYGTADPAAVVRLAEQQHADILAVQELTPDWRIRFRPRRPRDAAAQLLAGP